MSTSPRQIEFLARAVVNRLEDRGLAEFGDAETGIGVVSKVLQTSFRQLQQLEMEAWERLRESGAEPDAAAVEEEMRRLAAERSVLL